MTKPVTHSVLILDQSGSMEGTKADAVKGFNEKVQQAKIAAADGQDIYVSLITFNGDVFEHLWARPASEISEAKEEDYACGGSTAMRDAIGYAIEKLQATTDVKDENISYFLEVISDGAENASKHFPRHDRKLQDLISSVQETKRWTITYMGCSPEEVRKVAMETSIPLTNCAVWSNKSPAAAGRGMAAFGSTSEKFYKARKIGVKSCLTAYSDSENSLADFSDVVGRDASENPYVPPTIVVDNSIPNVNLNVSVNNVPSSVNVNQTELTYTSPFVNCRNPVKWTK
jgi:von Willebrand factor type A domain